MSSRHPPISNHRLARLALWLLALLAWFACGCIGARHRRRYGEVSIEKLEHAVRNLILIAAASLLPPRMQRARRHHIQPPRIALRAIAGVWLRRRLRTEGALTTRAQHLFAALRNWRALAAELAHRRRKGLTRLSPIAPQLGNAAPLVALAAPTRGFADTS